MEKKKERKVGRKRKRERGRCSDGDKKENEKERKIGRKRKI